MCNRYTSMGQDIGLTEGEEGEGEARLPTHRPLAPRPGKGNPIPIHLQQEILIRFDAHRREGVTKNEAYSRISREIKELSLEPGTIRAVIERLRPTTDIAKMYLKAKAYQLVKRVVRKASPAEAIDILSRPGMNVIEPGKSANSGGTGFFLSVSADTCGGVQIGAAIGQLPAQPVDDAFDPFTDRNIGGFDEESIDAPRVVGRSETAQSALDRARAKIAESRRALHSGSQGHGRVQESDGEPEGERGR